VFVIPTQVLTGYEGTFSGDAAWLHSKIDEAALILRGRLGDLDAWIGTDSYRRDALTVVIGRMVRRVMRNPQGLRSETAGDYSYTREASASSSSLYVADDDWALLGLPAQATPAIGTIGVTHEFRRTDGEPCW